MPVSLIAVHDFFDHMSDAFTDNPFRKRIGNTCQGKQVKIARCAAGPAEGQVIPPGLAAVCFHETVQVEGSHLGQRIVDIVEGIHEGMIKDPEGMWYLWNL